MVAKNRIGDVEEAIRIIKQVAYAIGRGKKGMALDLAFATGLLRGVLEDLKKEAKRKK